VKIPLPELLRTLREKQTERALRPWSERLGLRLWAYVALRPRLYAWVTRIGVRALKLMGGKTARISWLPIGSGWTVGRDMPAPQGRTFRELHAESKTPRVPINR
jgi:L-lactate dehydrogenase complex protein LldF